MALALIPFQKFVNADNGWANGFRKLADLTFPIYVLHYPILILFKSFLNFHENDRIQMWGVLILVLVISGMLGAIFQRQRMVWLRFFQKVHAVFKPFINKIYPRIHTSTKPI